MNKTLPFLGSVNVLKKKNKIYPDSIRGLLSAAPAGSFPGPFRGN